MQRSKIRLIWMVSIATIVCGCLPAAVVIAHESGVSRNTVAARRYVAAFAAMTKERRALLPQIEARVLRIATQAKRDCAGVLVGASRYGGTGQSSKMEEAIDGALEVVAARTTEDDMVQFDQRIKVLRWSNRTLTRMVRDFAAAVSTVSRLPFTPPICRNIRAWATTGFQRLPVAIIRFVAELNRSMETATTNKSANLEDTIERRILQYATHRTQERMRRASNVIAMVQEQELALWTTARYEVLRSTGLRVPRVK